MSMFSLRRPSPALVISAIALFVALGGSSYAAGALGHAPVATAAKAKHKRKSPTQSELEAALIKKLAPGLSVKYAKTAGSAVTASEATSAINASNATNATHATSATTAVSATTAASAATATDATNVDGHTFTQINATGTPTATVLSNFGGMTLKCTSPGGPSGTVVLSIVNASSSVGTFSADVTASSGESLQHGTVAAATGGISQTATFSFPTSDAAQVNFSYELPTGVPSGVTTSVVTGTFAITLSGSACSVFGNAEAS